MMLKLKLQYFRHLMRRVDSWKRLWCWEGLGAGGEGDDRGWDGWMASRTRWTWVWVNSRSWWWTGRPGVLRFMGLQRVGHDWANELNWTELRNLIFTKLTQYSAAKSLQLCPTLCDPIDSSPPGSPIPGILQARTLEWDAISFSNAWKWKVKGKSLSCVRLFTTPWTAAYQAPLTMGFARQEYWRGVPSPSLTQYSTQHHLLNNPVNSWNWLGLNQVNVYLQSYHLRSPTLFK